MEPADAERSSFIQQRARMSGAPGWAAPAARSLSFQTAVNGRRTDGRQDPCSRIRSYQQSRLRSDCCSRRHRNSRSSTFSGCASAVDELSRIVQHFDTDARRSGYDRSGALRVMGDNPEPLVRDQGQRMTENIERLARLRRSNKRCARDRGLNAWRNSRSISIRRSCKGPSGITCRHCR